MSLSNPSESRNPVKRFIKVKGGVGKLSYWDRDAKEELAIDTPFSFVVLDALSAVAGYHEASKSGIFSNEIRDTRDEVLRVRSRDGLLAEGLWSEISDKVKSKGAKFAVSLYLGFKDGDELAIGNVLLTGAALSAFLEFRKGKNLDREPGVAITGFSGPHTKGRTEYYIPEFASWTPTDLSAAEGLDRELQDYLNGRGSDKAEEPAESRRDDPWGSGPSQPAQAHFEAKPPF